MPCSKAQGYLEAEKGWESKPPSFVFSCLPPKSPSDWVSWQPGAEKMVFDDDDDDGGGGGGGDDDENEEETDGAVAAGSLPALSEKLCIPHTRASSFLWGRKP